MHAVASLRRAALAALVCATSSATRADCPAVGDEPVALAAVEPRLELKLADGRRLRLAGVEAASATPTMPNRDEIAVAAFAARLRGRSLEVTVLSARPDRWGRLVAFASVADGPDAGRGGGLAAAALAAGLARFRPEPAAAACRATLLSTEDAARRARLGLWADPYYSVLAADDRAAFAERVGTDVVVEARLAAVEAGTYRTRLRFAEPDGVRRSGSRDGLLEATIVPHAMKAFEAQGVAFTSLIGRTLRLRGLLDRRFGPRIELAGPDEIEILPESAPAGPR